MSQYLRDEMLKNLNISEAALARVQEVLSEIQHTINDPLKLNLEELKDDTSKINPNAIGITYIIRFDGKGYKLFDFMSLLKHYREAGKVERVSFTLESFKSLGTKRASGKSIELILDSQNSQGSSLTVQDDQSAWVDAAFCRIKEVIASCKNRNYLFRNAWVPFFIQISGVFVGVIISILVAKELAAVLTIQNSFVFSFLISLLIFSNVWTFLYTFMLSAAERIWPNLLFIEKRRYGWVTQTVVGAIIVSILFYLGQQIILISQSAVHEMIKR
jgi:hypothetical protein